MFNAIFFCFCVHSRENNPQSVWPSVTHAAFACRNGADRCNIQATNMQMSSVWGGEKKKSLLSTASESAVSRDSHFPGTLYANGKVPWRCIMLCGLINSMRKTVGLGRVRISSRSLASQLQPHNKEDNKEQAEQWVDLRQGFLLHHRGSQLKQLNQPAWHKNVSFQWDGHNLAAHPWSILFVCLFCSHWRCCATFPSVPASAFTWLCARVADGFLCLRKKRGVEDEAPLQHESLRLTLVCKRQLGGIQQCKHWQQLFQPPFSSGVASLPCFSFASFSPLDPKAVVPA